MATWGSPNRFEDEANAGECERILKSLMENTGWTREAAIRFCRKLRSVKHLFEDPVDERSSTAQPPPGPHN